MLTGGAVTPASVSRSGGTLLTTSGAVGAPAAPKPGNRTGQKPGPARPLE